MNGDTFTCDKYFRTMEMEILPNYNKRLDGYIIERNWNQISNIILHNIDHQASLSMLYGFSCLLAYPMMEHPTDMIRDIRNDDVRIRFSEYSLNHFKISKTAAGFAKLYWPVCKCDMANIGAETTKYAILLRDIAQPSKHTKYDQYHIYLA